MFGAKKQSFLKKALFDFEQDLLNQANVVDLVGSGQNLANKFKTI